MFTSAANVVSALLVVAAFSQDAVASSYVSRHGQHGHVRAGLLSKKLRRDMKIKRAAADDAQSSLQLDPSLIGPNLALNGQQVPAAGQVASLTSTNNFMNFCLTQNVPLTNGTQIAAGSCNPVPMGRLIASDKMPSSRFTFPPNGGTIKTNTTFTLKMTISNLDTGFFSNPATTFFSQPQTVNDQGIVQGHSHAVIIPIASWANTDLSDPRKFAFFKGLNDAADAAGQLTAEVTGGLPAGIYMLTSINTATSHQPPLVVQAQHGGLDDACFFEATDDGQPSADSPNAQNNNQSDDKAAAAASVSASASTSATDSAATSTATATANKDAAKADVANAAATTVTSASSVETTAASSTSSSDGKKNEKAQAAVAAGSASSSLGKNGKGGDTTSTASSSSTSNPATTSAATSGKGGKSS